MLEKLLITEIFAWLLIFCRVGAGMMVMPGFGETYVSPRFRLLMALTISVALTPVLRPLMPAVPTSPLALTVLLVAEIMVGLFIGGVSRLLVSATHVAGQIMAFQSGLSTATIFDFNQATQGTLLGNLLSVTAVILIFVMDLHHLMLRSLADSYTLFAPGTFPPTGDFATLVTNVVGKSFMVAIQLSSPLIVVGLMIYLGAGVLARLMPAMQVFFILLPPQILVSFFIVMTTISGFMLWYMNYFQETLTGFLTPG